MPTYLNEKRRRICQFTDYLRQMGIRRRKSIKSDCFIIFDDSPPEDAESPRLKEAAVVRVEAGGSLAGQSGETAGDWLGEEARPRYIQFAFRQDCFYMELPNATVTLHEVKQIARHRLGFYWARNRTDLRWVRHNWKDMLKWEPLQKVYLYRDEESAAEDMAFVFFQVWNFPVDSPLYIKAAAFGNKHDFNLNERIE